MTMDDTRYFFDHPYPRYGLAVTLQHHRVRDLDAALADLGELARLAIPLIEDGLDHFRVHTTDPEEATEWTYRYLKADELKASGQKADDRYFVAPHVVIDDMSTRYLIKESRKLLKKLRKGIRLGRTVEMKRSFAPFVTKLNAGTKSLSNPKAPQLEAIFSLVTTLTPRKPATQVDFTNQVILPDLDLRGLMDFVTVFRDMVARGVDRPLTLVRREGRKRRRPPLFDGNYPDAPRGGAFGPVGLMGALGRWLRKVRVLSVGEGAQPERVRAVIRALAGSPAYLVSYDGSLMRQEYVGHHVARLAEQHDLTAALAGLHYPEFYNTDHKDRRSGKPHNFRLMAGRFLRLYSHPAFRDFLSYRVQYDASLAPILNDYFMNERQTIDTDIVRAARAYGSFLNDVAYRVAKNEVDTKDTNRNLYEAKTNALAQLESTVMSVRRASALFGQLNVMAGRFSNSDVPAEAERFLEAAHTGEIDLDVAQELVLAYMRLRSSKKASEASPEDATDDMFVEDDEEEAAPAT